ncbi:MAG: translocation/assembly module TamB domain-containing protein [Terracidiphilus sp.]
MSEHEPMLPVPPEPPNPPRRPLLRRIVRIGAIAAVLLIVAALGLYFWANSSQCENLVREHLAVRIEAATGGRVQIASFRWQPLNLEAEAGGLVINGRESAGEAPYAQVGQLRVRLSLLGFWSPRILLRDLEVVHPALHLIVYPDGSTNQPHPQRPVTQGKSALDTLFDLKAGHVAVEEGILHYENRAAAFDFQNRLTQLDFAADDVSVRMVYVPPQGRDPESYRIDAGARDFKLSRGAPSHRLANPVEGRMQATVDLTRSAAYLRSLVVTARSKGIPDRTLNISGTLVDFAHPRWQAKANGELDMRLLEPVTGYPNAPQGIAHIDLTAEGRAGQFRVDGPIHVEDGAYIAPGVNARGVRLDARVHADAQQLVITSIIARLHQGGQLEGQLTLDHWLPSIPGSNVLEAAAAPPVKHSRFGRRQPAISATPAPPRIAPNTPPINGKVNAQLKNVPLDAVLDIVGQAPFQRLGLNAQLNGPATATWTDGDTRTLVVTSALNVSPSAQSVAQEVPANGTIDGTYFQRDGSVDLRTLSITLPASQLEAHGRLGAYPLSSPSTISVDFHSHDLGEFDRVLRDLGMQREGKSGTAALPVSLGGQADFDGTWSGSLADPHLAGTVKASNLSIEVPAGSNPETPRSVHWDSLEATGTYSATRISIAHSQLIQGPASISLQGSLAAAGSPPREPGIPNFDSNSLLHLHLGASKVGLDELLPLVGKELPVTGQINAQLQADGPIHVLDGSGWVELDGGVVYGEPISRIRAQGKITGQVLQLASVTVNDQAGKVSASGSYDLRSRHFQIEARGAGIDISRIQRLQNTGLAVTGKLGFSVTGSGTPDDPRMEGQGMLTAVTVSGEPLGSVEIAVRTANRTATYNLTTRFESASLSAHGQTSLSGEYATQAKLDFSQFNIGALLKMAHVQGLTGESALAGTVTVEGPLSHPDELRGDARLQNLAVTIVGVHLQSEGPVHATLANSRINLDPLHVTGEETDLHAQGNLNLKDKRQLDFASNGSINLKLAETLDPDLTASGTTTFKVEAHGTLQNPDLRGRIDFQNASLALEDLPNSLSQLQGTLEFNQNRLEVKSLTARTGGGLLSVSGYLAYQHGIFADLSVSGKDVRIRYPQGVSSLADANLKLQGTQKSLLFSGSVMITRFTVSPDLDIAALATQASRVQPVVPPDAPSNHVRLDVHVLSSPQLNFQNAYAKLAGDVDLHLRGTLASPSLLGRISIIEGSATIAGTRYELQRGEITFTNPVRIEPSIDLNATARVQDYDITLGIHGSPDKMSVTYRSDPPLPEADVVALLALGRTQDQERIYTQQQEQVTSNPTTDALLGGALNATVSSRVQKLFGAGSVKVDPNYLGVLGNSTTRITVAEQLGRYVTFTYATDVDTTAQQLLQAEISINRHVSLLVSRDESDVFSVVIKATRRYR